MDDSNPHGASRIKAASLAATAVLLVVFFMPGDRVPSVGLPGLDKLVHALLFATWAFALRLDFPGLGRPGLLAAGAAFGALTEIGQLFAEGRAFEFLDLGADLLGILAASLAPEAFLEGLRAWYRRLPGAPSGGGRRD